MKNKYSANLINMLNERWPELFDLKNPRPLKVGIFDDVMSHAIDEGDRIRLKRALVRYTNTCIYLACFERHEHRYDLSGVAVAEVLESEKEYAKKKENEYRQAAKEKAYAKKKALKAEEQKKKKAEAKKKQNKNVKKSNAEKPKAPAPAPKTSTLSLKRPSSANIIVKKKRTFVVPA